MLVVAIASQKGGSGKTTLSGHLAVEAERTGAGPVALIDTDPQGSLAQWWNARVETTPVFAKVAANDLQSALRHLQQSGIRLVVIDTPPAVTDSISRVIAHADLVIAPTRPSPHDLRSVGATVDLAERHDKPLIFVVNGATARARINGEMAVALSQHGTVAPVTIHNRVDFAASMVDGRTAGEVVPQSQSAKEVADLWIYVQDRLARLDKDPTLSPQTKPSHFAVSALSVLPGGPDLPEPDLSEPSSLVEVSDDSSGGDAKAEAGSTAHLEAQPSIELPPIAVDGGGSPAGDAQPNGGVALMSADERQNNPRRRWFVGSERQAANFGRR